MAKRSFSMRLGLRRCFTFTLREAAPCQTVRALEQYIRCTDANYWPRSMAVATFCGSFPGYTVAWLRDSGPGQGGTVFKAGEFLETGFFPVDLTH